MSKTFVTNEQEKTRVPFLRGILTRSLQVAGLSFDDAYALASKVREVINVIIETLSKEFSTSAKEIFGKC